MVIKPRLCYHNNICSLYLIIRNILSFSTIISYIYIFTIGACESDYPVDEEFLKLGVEPDKTEIPDDTKSSDSVSSIGNITFVSCSTGPSSSPSPTNEEKGTFFIFFSIQ